MAYLQKRSKTLPRELSKCVSKLSESVSEKGVHRLRTTIRRVETLIEHAGVGPGKKQKRVLQELRALRKRAGKVRDLDIQIRLLSSIGNGSASPDRRALTAELRRKREKQASRLAAAARDLEGPKLLSRIARMTEKSVAAPAQDSLAPLENVRQQLSELATGHASRQVLKPPRLHALRIRLKLLRYQVELAAETPEQKELAQELKSAQDTIGEWHDWEMLAKSAEKFFAGRLNCALLVEIRALLAARYSEANSTTLNILASFSAGPKKKPSTETLQALAQRA